MPWNIANSVLHARKAALPKSTGKCATFVRLALEAGGLTISTAGSGSAKDYGTRLTKAGFIALTVLPASYKQGDVAVIDGFSKNAAPDISKDHIDGHLALFDGTHWISDFVQRRPYPYPGNDYDLAEPRFVIYRYPQQ